MSLSKTYRLGCDISELLMDRVLQIASDSDDFRTRLDATRDERHAQEKDCTLYSVDEPDAVRARRTAKAQGWVRHHEERPIYGGSDTMTKISYDLCPGCKPIAAQR